MSNNTNTEVLVAGAIAAFTIDLLVYPLDTLKTRWQSQDYLDTFKKSASSATQHVHKQPFRGLYQGVGSVIVATLPAAGVFFTTYESTKSAFSRALPDGTPMPLVHSLASGTAELASCLVLTPAEVIKQNAQMIRSSSGGAGGGGGTSLRALRELRASEGGAYRRLWTGYTALAARNLPFTAMQFPMFEYLRASLWQWRDDKRQSAKVLSSSSSSSRREAGGVDPGQGLLETGLVNGASAALSGSVAAVLTTPTDVVKTRMMLTGGEKRQDGGEKHKVAAKRGAGSLQVAKDVYAELGVRGLFRGGLFRAGWTALGSGLYLGSYEVAKVWLKDGKRTGGNDGTL